MKTAKIAIEGFKPAERLYEIMPELFSAKGALKVKAKKSGEAGYRAKKTAKGAEIEYGEASDLTLALGDLVCGKLKTGGESVVPAFKFRGVMHDCSRNGVPSVEFLKKALAKLALLGINKFCLYTEDVYEVDGEPLVGFGRGAYTQAEIRELDAFAFSIGIEMFPCIQTLGHLQEIFKFGKFNEVVDNGRSVLNVLKEESYEFVRKLVKSASKPYRSKLVHIGTDEPWGIGRGAALDFDKPVKPGQLYALHIAKMDKLCKELGLQPIIWGDYILGHTGEKALDKGQDSIIPRSVLLSYWNYYSTDPARYERDMDAYLKGGYKIMVSPGVWNWNRFFPNSQMAIDATETFLRVAHKKGVDMGLTTMWGDDGQECLFDSNWPALAQFAAWCRENEPKEKDWKERSLKICGVPGERAELFSEMQNLGLEAKHEGRCFNLSKGIFYDDPLFGYMNMMLDGEKCGSDLLKMAKKAATAKPASKIDGEQLKLAALFLKIAGEKFELIRAARKAVRKKDRKTMKTLAKKALAIAADMKSFKDFYEKLWLAERKPFGLELMEVRFAGMESRLKTFASKAEAFAKGRVASVPELELERPEGLKIGHLNLYTRVSSMCPISHNRTP